MPFARKCLEFGFGWRDVVFMSVILHVNMDLSFTRLSQQFLWNLSTKEDKSAVSCTLHEGVIWGEGWLTVGMKINTHQMETLKHEDFPLMVTYSGLMYFFKFSPNLFSLLFISNPVKALHPAFFINKMQGSTNQTGLVGKHI